MSGLAAFRRSNVSQKPTELKPTETNEENVQTELTDRKHLDNREAPESVINVLKKSSYVSR